MGVATVKAAGLRAADVDWTDQYVEVERSALITEPIAVIVAVPDARWVVGIRLEAPSGIERLGRVTGALMVAGYSEPAALAAAMTYLIPPGALDLAERSGVCGETLVEVLDVTIEMLAERFHYAGLICPLARAFHAPEAGDALGNVISLDRVRRGLGRQLASCVDCPGPRSPVTALIAKR